MKSPERATEIEWLRWFYNHADFGPYDCDVQNHMKKQFMAETGKNLPGAYNYDENGQTIDMQCAHEWRENGDEQTCLHCGKIETIIPF